MFYCKLVWVSCLFLYQQGCESLHQIQNAIYAICTLMDFAATASWSVMTRSFWHTANLKLIDVV